MKRKRLSITLCLLLVRNDRRVRLDHFARWTKPCPRCWTGRMR